MTARGPSRSQRDAVDIHASAAPANRIRGGQSRWLSHFDPISGGDLPKLLLFAPPFLFLALLGIVLRNADVRLHILEAGFMVVSVRVGVFCIRDHCLELLFTEVAVKRFERRRYFILEGGTTGHQVLGIGLRNSIV
jgi:hypothetical protein